MNGAGFLSTLISYLMENYMFEIKVITVTILAITMIFMAYEGELG